MAHTKYHRHSWQTEPPCCNTCVQRGLIQGVHTQGMHKQRVPHARGSTPLKLVAGTHKQPCPHTTVDGAAYAGVAAQQYHGVPQHHLMPQGNLLLHDAGMWAGNWQLQQDNASYHKVQHRLQCKACPRWTLSTLAFSLKGLVMMVITH